MNFNSIFGMHFGRCCFGGCLSFSSHRHLWDRILCFADIFIYIVAILSDDFYLLHIKATTPIVYFYFNLLSFSILISVSSFIIFYIFLPLKFGLCLKAARLSVAIAAVIGVATFVVKVRPFDVLFSYLSHAEDAKLDNSCLCFATFPIFSFADPFSLQYPLVYSVSTTG